MPHNPALTEYYAKRAQEYEQLYTKPERQADLAAIKRRCAQAVAGQNVLEVACGTGFWTQPAAQTAKTIVATDFNPEVLEITRSKQYGCEVSFERADAFNLGSLGNRPFTAGMAMHWWSHLRKSELRSFLEGFHRRFPPGAPMIFMDNRFVAGSSTPISRTDDEGNTYQMRRLADGTRHEVLKNFPVENEVKTLLDGVAGDWCWTDLPYYWFLTYRLRRSARDGLQNPAE